jgi:predicted neuraminidase
MKAAMRFLILVILLPLMASYSFPETAVEKPFYKAELIFKKTLRYIRCHSSTVTELPDGSLLAAWWNGSEEGAKDLVIRAARKAPGKDYWEPPQMIADTPDETDANPVLFTAPNGEVWLVYRVGARPFLRIMWQKSYDMGRTWQQPEVLVDKQGWALRSRIVVLRNGDIIIPVMNNPVGSAFLISSDAGKSWQTTKEIESNPRNNEPSVVQRSDGSLLTYLRTFFRNPKERFVLQSESFDNGRTWSKAAVTNIKNPSSAVELLRLRNGHIALVFNDTQEGRSNLSLAISLDDAKTWSYKRALEEASSGEFAYPTMLQSADGRIHLVYTFRRPSIKHVEVNEAWIMEQPWRR